jgi:hypothetical protein
MSRLYRGLWYCEAHYPDGLIFITQPVEYDQAAVTAPLLGALWVILRPIPHTRARWEYLAPYEASDPPKWTDESED